MDLAPATLVAIGGVGLKTLTLSSSYPCQVEPLHRPRSIMFHLDMSEAVTTL